MKNITQFQGESRRDAIVNHFSLDLEEEYEFFHFIEEMGYDENAPDVIITSLHEIFKNI